MAMIHVNRGATNLGVFSEEEVREGLRAGRFQPNDLGWREGMPSWKQLSQFPELGAAPAAGVPPPQAGAGSTITPAPGSTSEIPDVRSGLPWEHRRERGFLNAFIETLVMVLTKPDQAFRIMKTEGGMVEPFIYALIGAGAGAIVSFCFSLALQSMGFFVGRHHTFGMLAGLGVGSVLFVIFLPVLIAIGLFVGAAIVHLCLMIVGGANKTFETTFRVISFSQGSTGPLQMIPVCGGLIAGIWAIVINCIGLARAHETSTGRAIFAVFLPLIVCCGGGLLIAVMFGAIGAWSAAQH